MFVPRLACSGLFWAKRATTKFTDNRVPVFGYWNNLGAPVVSFYSACQVRRMVTDSGGTIVAEHAESERFGHADAVIRKANLSIVAQRLGV